MKGAVRRIERAGRPRVRPARTTLWHRRRWGGGSGGGQAGGGARGDGVDSAGEAWHTLPATEAARRLATDPAAGLGGEEVRRRRERFGPNAVEVRRRTPGGFFLAQLREPMVLVLAGAALLALLSGQQHDAVAIAVIVVLNAVLGTLQEFRAERALAALRRLTAPQARVLRGGRPTVVPAEEVVPGDVLLLEAGDRVAADGRVWEARTLAVDESLLTGESVPVEKTADPLPEGGLSPGDRRNMVFQGTSVTRGRGVALVVATGAATEAGRLAAMLGEAGAASTPLQRELSLLGRRLLLLSLAVAALVGMLGAWRGEDAGVMLLTAVSLAVAAIPEGLPAVVTAVLAVGVQRMARRGAVVRRLAAVETLGCATLVAADKTGTLTRNEMEVAAVCPAAGRRWHLRAEGDGGALPPGTPPALATLLLLTASLCNDARRAGPSPTAQGPLAAARLAWRRGGRDAADFHGDPTEIALLRWAEAGRAAAGLTDLAERAFAGRGGEVPFDQDRMWMAVAATVRDAAVLPGVPPSPRHLFVKGAPERVLELCRRAWGPAGPLAMGEEERAGFLRLAEEGARGGLRVLALAWRGLAAPGAERDLAREVGDLTFLGLVGLLDPPRAEAPAAVERCRRAGIEVVMLTGDHASTALAVARRVGLAAAEGEVLTGSDLARWPASRLAAALGTARVFARVTPEQKLALVRAYQARGEVVAVTGDGVNDAPALKEADIGIAMGLAGTEVAREAADMVLADDNFATIVAAVEEGRGIYFNLQRFIAYLLACNLGEIGLMLGAVVAGLPVPLLPSNLLLVNLVTDGLPALALGLAPPPARLMDSPPRARDRGVLDGGQWLRLGLAGAAFGVVGLAVFAWELWRTGETVPARTAVFASLAASQLIFAGLLARAGAGGAALRRLWVMPLALVLSALALLAAILVPGLQPYFHATRLDLAGWAASLAGAALAARLALAAWRSSL